MKTRFGISAIIILAIAVFTLSLLYSHSLKEKGRLKDNQNALLTEVKYYKTKDSLNVASVEKLTLTNSEFKRFNEDLVKTVENLNIKVRRLQSVSQTAVKTEYIIRTEVKDSIIYRDNKPQTVQCIKQKDKWMSLDGCIINKRFEGTSSSIDSIDQIVHRVPRKLLFLKYGTKGIRQEVVSKNPNSTIFYTKYIELKN